MNKGVGQSLLDPFINVEISPPPQQAELGQAQVVSQLGESHFLGALLLHGSLSGLHHVLGLQHAHVPSSLQTDRQT